MTDTSQDERNQTTEHTGKTIEEAFRALHRVTASGGDCKTFFARCRCGEVFRDSAHHGAGEKHRVHLEARVARAAVLLDALSRPSVEIVDPLVRVTADEENGIRAAWRRGMGAGYLTSGMFPFANVRIEQPWKFNGGHGGGFVPGRDPSITKEEVEGGLLEVALHDLRQEHARLKREADDHERSQPKDEHGRQTKHARAKGVGIAIAIVQPFVKRERERREAFRETMTRTPPAPESISAKPE